MIGTDFRVLMENEDYYKLYGSAKEEDAWLDEDTDDEDIDDYESLYEE